MSTPHRNFGKTFDNAIVLQQKKRESQERERNARDFFGRIHGVWPELTQEQLDNRPPSNLNVVVTPPLKFDKNMFKNRLPPQSFVVKDIDYLLNELEFLVGNMEGTTSSATSDSSLEPFSIVTKPKRVAKPKVSKVGATGVVDKAAKCVSKLIAKRVSEAKANETEPIAKRQVKLVKQFDSGGDPRCKKNSVPCDRKNCSEQVFHSPSGSEMYDDFV